VYELKRQEQAEMIVREGLLRQTKEDLQEIRFRNELLIQQLAERQKKYDQDTKKLRKQ
jgi:hypothetical protein